MTHSDDGGALGARQPTTTPTTLESIDAAKASAGSILNTQEFVSIEKEESSWLRVVRGDHKKAQREADDIQCLVLPGLKAEQGRAAASRQRVLTEFWRKV